MTRYAPRRLSAYCASLLLESVATDKRSNSKLERVITIWPSEFQTKRKTKGGPLIRGLTTNCQSARHKKGLGLAGSRGANCRGRVMN